MSAFVPAMGKPPETGRYAEDIKWKKLLQVVNVGLLIYMKTLNVKILNTLVVAAASIIRVVGQVGQSILNATNVVRQLNFMQKLECITIRINCTLGTLANFNWLLFSRFRGGIVFGGCREGVPKDGYAGC